MASKFMMTLGAKQESSVFVRYYTVDSGATFKKGELVYFDTASQTLKGCGADPSLIAGQVGCSAAFALGTEWPGNIFGGSQAPVFCLSGGTMVFMSSASTPATTDIGVDYGIDRDSGTGYWQVDTTDTSTKRVIVLDIYNTPQQEGYLVRFDPKYLQFGGVQA